MICNLPIIATNCRGNRDLVKDCVDIDDKNELAKRIIQKMKSKEEKIEYDMSKYKLEQILEQMKEIYIGEK